MGHMNQNPKGIRSTWTAITDASSDALYEAACAAIYTTQAEYNITYAAAFKPQVCNKVHIFDVALETLYTDDCGQFPVQSFSGNQYIKCAYLVGANAILIEQFQTKSNAHRISAHNRILERLKAAGMQVDLQIMDNEVTKAYLDNITGKWET
jgi:hypothetical protein